MSKKKKNKKFTVLEVMNSTPSFNHFTAVQRAYKVGGVEGSKKYNRAKLKDKNRKRQEEE
jgi:hypothetical protein